MLDRVRRAYRALNQSKALAERYPEVVYREHLTSGVIADATTAAIENYVGYATLYKSYVWVHKAVSIIANSIAPHAMQVVNSAGQVQAEHPIALLLSNPGSVDPAQLRAVMMVHKLLGGEWFLEEVPDKLGRPRELWTRRPDSVTVYSDQSKPNYPTVLEYEVVGMAQRIPAASMIHDRFVNPLSEWRGLAPTGAALAGIKLDIYNQASAIAFAHGGARPDYAVTTEEALTPDERERLEIQINTKYGSPEGRSRPMVLESGQGIKVLSFPPKDTEGLAQREMARDEVAAIFGVPDILMGFGNDSYDTEEKRKGAEGALWTLALSPLIFRRDTVLTWHYRKRGLLKPDESVTTDLSSVAVLQEDILPKLDAAKRFFDMGVPYNTIESRLRLGTGPIPSGAVGYLPMALVPADTASMIPAEPVQPSQARSVTRAVAARRPSVAMRLEKAAGHTSVIAALWVPEVTAHQLALQTELLGLAVQPEAADDLHITLAYLGKLPDLDAAARVAIDETLASVARRMPPIDGVVNGIIRFTTDQGDGTHALCVAFDAPALGRWRHAIVEALIARGLPVVENHGFTPHITVAYIPAEADTPTLALDQVDPIRIEALTLAAGPQRREYPLRLDTAMASALRDVTKASAQQTSAALRRIKLSMARRMEADVSKELDALSRRVVGRARKHIDVAIAKQATSGDYIWSPPDTTKPAPVTKAGLPDLDELLAADDLDPLQRLIERYALEICRASWETWNTSLAATIGFDEADPAVVAAIKQGGDRIINIENTTRDAIRSALSWATENSLSLSQFVNGTDDHAGLASIVEESYANRARTIARTELAYAQNVATFARYQGAGVDRVMVLDNGVEDSDPVCTELNGTVQTLAWAKANPLQHPNCFIGSTQVFAPNVLAGYAREFHGEVVVIRTATDNHFTCTPNHPILTRRGWVAAGKLRHGDQIVRSLDSQGIVRLLNPDDDQVPAAIEDRVRALHEALGSTSAVVPGTAVDFHGDGREGDVNIVFVDRELRSGDNPPVMEYIQQWGFDSTHESIGTGLTSDSTSDQLIVSTLRATHGSMGGTGILKPLVGSAQTGEMPLVIASCADVQPAPIEGVAQRGVAYAVLTSQDLDPLARDVPPMQPFIIPLGTEPEAALTECALELLGSQTNLSADAVERLTRLIAFVEVVEVELKPFAAHVYNLSTTQGWYIAEGIITHNCLRTFAPYVD